MAKARKKKAAATVKVGKFQAADHQKSETAIREFLVAAAMEGSNPDVFLAALGEVAKARGIAALAERSGLGRESLYKTLAPGSKPRYETICKLVGALRVKLTMKAA
jgi:probable addiction module antidote protein